MHVTITGDEITGIKDDKDFDDLVIISSIFRTSGACERIQGLLD